MGVSGSGMACSMSRSMMPLPMWCALGRGPLAPSDSSRTSIRMWRSPAWSLARNSSIENCWTRAFAALTSFKNPGEWVWAISSSRRSPRPRRAPRGRYGPYPFPGVLEARQRREGARPAVLDRRVPRQAPGGRALHPDRRARGVGVGQGPPAERAPHGQGHHRARHRAGHSGPGHAHRALLRRRVPERAHRRQPAEDGLHERRLARRGLARLDRARAAHRDAPAGRGVRPLHPHPDREDLMLDSSAPLFHAARYTDPQQVLEAIFGYREFRPGQRRIIDAVLAGRDCIGVMPTGAGKSLTFQVPAKILPGAVLVISPLISLMKDQVDALVRLGFRATTVNSSLPFEERRDRMAAFRRGEVELLYLAPEALEGSLRGIVSGCPVSLVVVDEAHCISHWGHDFRPAYRKLAGLKEELGEIPVLALTATATRRVAGGSPWR